MLEDLRRRDLWESAGRQIVLCYSNESDILPSRMHFQGCPEVDPSKVLSVNDFLDVPAARWAGCCESQAPEFPYGANDRLVFQNLYKTDVDLNVDGLIPAEGMLEELEFLVANVVSDAELKAAAQELHAEIRARLEQWSMSDEADVFLELMVSAHLRGLSDFSTINQTLYANNVPVTPEGLVSDIKEFSRDTISVEDFTEFHLTRLRAEGFTLVWSFEPEGFITEVDSIEAALGRYKIAHGAYKLPSRLASLLSYRSRLSSVSVAELKESDTTKIIETALVLLGNEYPSAEEALQAARSLESY